MSDLNMSHWKISGFVSSLLFGFTLVIKLGNFDFGSHWNTLILFSLQKKLSFVVQKLRNTNFKIY